MAFLREPFNIKRGVEWSTSMVVEEKLQLLMSPLLALGGAIGVWSTKKSLGCAFRVYGMSDPFIYCRWHLLSIWLSLWVWKEVKNVSIWNCTEPKVGFGMSWLYQKVYNLPNCFRKIFRKKKFFLDRYIELWESVSLKDRLTDPKVLF